MRTISAQERRMPTMISIILFIVLLSSMSTPSLSSKKAEVHQIPQSIGIRGDVATPQKSSQNTHQIPKSINNGRSNSTSKPVPSNSTSTSKPVQSNGSGQTPKATGNVTSNSTSKPVQSSDVTYDFYPMIRVYKNGTVERLTGKTTVPPSLDPKTGVLSKDVAISHKKSISLRLYLAKSAINTTTNSTHHHKLPLLVYFHGGGFCIENASSPLYHNYLNTLVSAANVVAVSVDYRLAPEHPLPIAYKDSWAALRWVASHFSGNRTEEWLNKYADPERLYFAGDSAGANIAHHMALQVGTHHQLSGAKLVGIVLVHPFFWGAESIGAEKTLSPAVKSYVAGVWRFVYPLTSGVDDPLLNPGKDPKLGQLGCPKVLVCVAGKDSLRERGRYYSEVLGKSGWKGTVKVMEAKGEGHVFHLFHPTSPNAVAMLKAISSFLN